MLVVPCNIHVYSSVNVANGNGFKSSLKLHQPIYNVVKLSKIPVTFTCFIGFESFPQLLEILITLLWKMLVKMIIITILPSSQGNQYLHLKAALDDNKYHSSLGSEYWAEDQVRPDHWSPALGSHTSGIRKLPTLQSFNILRWKIV